MFAWRFPLLAGAVTCLLILPTLFCDPDLSLLFYIPIGVVIVLTLIVLGIWARRYRRLVLSMITVYLALSGLLLANYNSIRTCARWALLSRRYKAKVRATAVRDGQLKHFEWDGWGWAGMNTSVFVVYDPTNSLLAPAKAHQSGKFQGIPCEADVVRRLEDQWYSVQLYTPAMWDDCE
jgi:hypothetical protein